jgi:ribose transport system ATP-binding protein
VFGLAGLVGSGRSEVARLIFGADRRDKGSILVDGKEVHARSPREAIDEGIGLLTEDRNRFGLFLQMNVRENISLATLQTLVRGFLINRTKETDLAEGFVRWLDIRPPAVDSGVDTLSGGNRQKVILARWLSTQSRLFIFDEPTAGVDVGAKVEIQQLILRLADEGKGIVVISSDLPELLALCDRIGVMREGRLSGILDRTEATEERILLMATSTAGVACVD